MHARGPSPRAVNFTALPARLSSTWRSRSGSPTHQRRDVGVEMQRELEALRRAPAGAAGRRRAVRSLAQARTARRPSSMRPASTFCRSRMSLMISTSAVAEPLTTSTSSRCSLSSGVRAQQVDAWRARRASAYGSRATSRRGTATWRRTPRCASSRARASASWYCTRSVASRNIHSAPRSRPLATIGWKSNSSTRPSASVHRLRDRRPAPCEQVVGAAQERGRVVGAPGPAARPPPWPAAR